MKLLIHALQNKKKECKIGSCRLLVQTSILCGCCGGRAFVSFFCYVLSLVCSAWSHAGRHHSSFRKEPLTSGSSLRVLHPDFSLRMHSCRQRKTIQTKIGRYTKFHVHHLQEIKEERCIDISTSLCQPLCCCRLFFFFSLSLYLSISFCLSSSLFVFVSFCFSFSMLLLTALLGISLRRPSL